MAKKGGAVQLQIEVETEEDWNKLVKREGLIGKHMFHTFIRLNL